MESCCITSYVIIGNETDIKFLHKNLQQLYQGKRTMLKYIAQAFCPHINYEVDGYFYDLQLSSKRKISFSVKTEAAPCPDIWQRICREYLTTKLYYFAQVADTGNYRTNDSAGHYFPQRYIIADAEGSVNAVVAQRHLYDYINKTIHISEPFTTLESFAKAVKTKLAGNRIFDILVVDNRDKCISHETSLICQWL